MYFLYYVKIGRKVFLNYDFSQSWYISLPTNMEYESHAIPSL